MSHDEKNKGSTKGPLRRIDASFNIHETGWKNFGNGNKYVANNINLLINGELVQERVDRGVMYGFFGHNSNPAMEPVENLTNLASHVTTHIKFYPKSGDVEHKQNILQTDAGKAVLSLHDSGYGNFSWRGKGNRSYVGTKFNPEAARHLRLDYVYVPGMVAQDKKDVFIQESLSAESEDIKDVVEQFEKNGLVIEEGLKMAADWQASGILLSGLETDLEESMIQQDLFLNEIAKLKEIHNDSEMDLSTRQIAIRNCLKDTHYAFSDEAMSVLLGKTISESEFYRDEDEFKLSVLSLINEIKAYSNIDATHYPGARRDLRLPKSDQVFKKKREKFDPKNSVLGVYVS